MWILIAFLNPVLHGFANVLDNYLTNKLFKSAWTLTFYSTIFNVLFLPIVLLIQIPGLPPVHLLPFFFAIALIEVFYLYPYYKALQSDDTSVVSSLFSLGRIFVPILAFMFVGEVLQFNQYLGFFIIIFASAALTLNNHGTLRLNKSFFYMMFCSVLLAVETVMYKYIFENVSWSTGFVWTGVLSSIIVLFFLMVPKIRQNIMGQTSDLKQNLHLFMFQEFSSFAGSAALTLAISLVPVTLAAGIESSQPFFVLIYALLFGRSYSRLFKEGIDRRSVFKKTLLFLIMLLGIILIVK